MIYSRHVDNGGHVTMVFRISLKFYGNSTWLSMKRRRWHCSCYQEMLGRRVSKKRLQTWWTSAGSPRIPALNSRCTVLHEAIPDRAIGAAAPQLKFFQQSLAIYREGKQLFTWIRLADEDRSTFKLLLVTAQVPYPITSEYSLIIKKMFVFLSNKEREWQTLHGYTFIMVSNKSSITMRRLLNLLIV